MNYHPRHCHFPAHHKNRNILDKKLWTQKNSVNVYEYSPYRSSSRDLESDVYFSSPKSSPVVARGALINKETSDLIVSRIQKTPAAKHWEKIGIKQHIGICVPVFSLRTESSSGVGEYLDLLPLIDFCSEDGLDVIQLLPLNDTNPFDCSPFSPISSFSLNPKLLSLKKLPNYEKQTEEMKGIIAELEKLNAENRVKWEEVIKLKRNWLWDYFEQEEQKATLKSQEYKEYIDKNKTWLEGYGLFCLLKNKNEWRHWEDWEESNQLPKNFDPYKTSILSVPFFKAFLALADNRKELEYNMFTQYLCCKQMTQVKEYAESKKVFLKGDIPFLVSADSVDVWLNRSLFNMEKTAGAPPDMFAVDGQNWGVPIYNWDNVRKQDYLWWKQRILTANQFYHIFRIDHVVGFYRVWAIPQGCKGSEGRFEPSNPDVFIKQGEEIMKMLLENCSMLPIGEDLGTVPPEVRASLQKLGICGTKVMRWERRWEDEANEQPFIPFQEYNADSMTVVSTHDSETLGQWWVNQPKEVEAYCKATKMEKRAEDSNSLSPETRYQLLKQSNNTSSLFHINLLQEYLAVEPSLIHEDPDLERINLPGQVLESNWSYRIKSSMEEINSNESLKKKMKELSSPSTNNIDEIKLDAK